MGSDCKLSHQYIKQQDSRATLGAAIYNDLILTMIPRSENFRILNASIICMDIFNFLFAN